MRDIALVLAISVALGIALFYPFAGVLLWTWFTIQNPHEEAYSFSHLLPLNLIIAIVTVIAILISRERKFPPLHFLTIAMFAFLAWATFNSFFAFAPDWSWPFWSRVWKIFALGFVVATLARNHVRIHAVIWMIVISLFYYGVKGGIFTLLTGGQYHVNGPENSQIGDNNALALALLMALPLANYLRAWSANKYVSWSIVLGMAFTLVSVIGSYSRGAYIALAALGVTWWFRSRHKLIYMAVAAAFAIAIASFMPDAFWDRINSIQTAGDDPSFHGRWVAWQVALGYANDHFPLGAGFYGPQLPAIFHSYFPHEQAHAAHSIYFQVLGEHGYVGLAIYLLVLVGAFWTCSRIVRRARGRDELAWAASLAVMIQTTLVVFCVGGAALSMAYYDVFILCIGLLVPLAGLAGRSQPAIGAGPHRRHASVSL
jgi:probable O-glycosylation ligase (exosortase A-associated)